MLRENLVIDSFLAVDGRVTRPDLHRQRLESSVRELLGAELAEQLPGTFADMASVLQSGRRFPRLEARAGGITWIDRPAPEHSLVLHVTGIVEDARDHPSHKGPDLGWLQAQASGAHILLVRGELVVETHTAAVMIVRDGQGFVPDQPRICSTTENWFADSIASVVSFDMTRDDLAQASHQGQAFALNALHGPRVLQLGDEPVPQHALDQAGVWRQQWLEEATPLT
ncbi:hypothetical protein [Flaviflexus huanghaiensis]|uniref:hypothetical protein n=1 Tax=Flaviflexus huanghaiensis TaxID=1111473 RepID=UPI0015FB8E35|nr:hypothetical protein [Flaviflexus huanghaiensis]